MQIRRVIDSCRKLRGPVYCLRNLDNEEEEERADLRSQNKLTVRLLSRVNRAMCDKSALTFSDMILLACLTSWSRDERGHGKGKVLRKHFSPMSRVLYYLAGDQSLSGLTIVA